MKKSVAVLIRTGLGIFALSAVAAAAVAATAGAAPADEKHVEKIAMQLCANCHGADGNASSPNFPRLAGQTQEYLETQLKSFREKSRTDADAHDYMWGMARALDDATISGLAVYFSTRKPAPGRPGDIQLMAKGKNIFENGIPDKGVPACAACHGAEAHGLVGFPRLAGQHASYLVKQMKVFHTDQRPSGEVMKGVVKPLSDDEMQAAAAYLQSRD